MNKKEKIIAKIENTTEQINKFEKRLKTSDLCEEMYDAAILEKAVLMKELENCDKNSLIDGIKSKVKKVFSKGDKKLICDYFRS